MKAHPAILRQHAIDLRQQGKTTRQIARETGLSHGTIQSWIYRRHAPCHASRRDEGKTAGHAPRHEPQSSMSWQQCLHFDSAHLFRVGDSKPVCADSPPGLATTPGMLWLPHDGCVRQCKRCAKWEAENDEMRDRSGSGTSQTTQTTKPQ